MNAKNETAGTVRAVRTSNPLISLTGAGSQPRSMARAFPFSVLLPSVYFPPILSVVFKDLQFLNAFKI